MINRKHTRRIFWPRSFIYYTRFFNWSSLSSLILIMMMMFVAKKRKQPKYCHFVYGCDKNFEWVFCFVLVTIFVDDSTRMIFGRKNRQKKNFNFFFFVFGWNSFDFCHFFSGKFQKIFKISIWKVLNWKFFIQRRRRRRNYQNYFVLPKNFNFKKLFTKEFQWWLLLWLVGWLKELILHLKKNKNKTAEFRNQNSRISWKFCVSSQKNKNFIRQTTNNNNKIWEYSSYSHKKQKTYWLPGWKTSAILEDDDDIDDDVSIMMMMMMEITRNKPKY